MSTTIVTKDQLLNLLPSRAVIILRGCPGAGKTTFIANLEKYLGSPFAPFEVVSADHFFVEEKTGNYVFNSHLLGQAHAACKDNFEYFTNMHGKRRPLYVVVDNTNTTMKEMQPYIAQAEKTGWDVIIVTFLTPAALAAKRNIHGVPKEKVLEMSDRVVKTEIPEYLTHYVIE